MTLLPHLATKVHKKSGNKNYLAIIFGYLRNFE